MASEEYKEQLKQEILDMFDQLPPVQQEEVAKEIGRLVLRRIIEDESEGGFHVTEDEI